MGVFGGILKDMKYFKKRIWENRGVEKVFERSY